METGMVDDGSSNKTVNSCLATTVFGCFSIMLLAWDSSVFSSILNDVIDLAVYLQCFDTVGWTSGRTSGLYETSLQPSQRFLRDAFGVPPKLVMTTEDSSVS